MAPTASPALALAALLVGAVAVGTGSAAPSGRHSDAASAVPASAAAAAERIYVEFKPLSAETVFFSTTLEGTEPRFEAQVKVFDTFGSFSADESNLYFVNVSTTGRYPSPTVTEYDIDSFSFASKSFDKVLLYSGIKPVVSGLVVKEGTLYYGAASATSPSGADYGPVAIRTVKLFDRASGLLETIPGKPLGPFSLSIDYNEARGTLAVGGCAPTSIYSQVCSVSGTAVIFIKTPTLENAGTVVGVALSADADRVYLQTQGSFNSTIWVLDVGETEPELLVSERAGFSTIRSSRLFLEGDTLYSLFNATNIFKGTIEGSSLSEFRSIFRQEDSGALLSIALA